MDEALEHIILQVDVHPLSPERAQPRETTSMPGSGSSSVDPYDDAIGVSNAWLCTLCGSGDAGAPEGVCLMCTAFGNVRNGKSARVGRNDAMLGHDGLELLDHGVLHSQILKHGFDD